MIEILMTMIALTLAVVVYLLGVIKTELEYVSNMMYTELHDKYSEEIERLEGKETKPEGELNV